MNHSYAVCPSCDGLNRFDVDLALSKTPICGKCKTDLPFHRGVVTVSASQLSVLTKKSPLPVIVDFWAPWCGPCKTFAPTFESAAIGLKAQLVFAKLNTEAHPLAGDVYSIRSIPTLTLFRNGREIARQSGAMPAEMLNRWIHQNLGAA